MIQQHQGDRAEGDMGQDNDRGAQDMGAEIVARVGAAPKDGRNAAITDRDVAILSGLAPAALADTRKVLQGLGVTLPTLDKRIKIHRSPLRVASSDKGNAWARALECDTEDRPRPTIANLCLILENTVRERLSFDTMASVPCLDGRPITDHNVTAFRRDIGKRWRANFGAEDMAAALSLVGMESRSFHPVRDYLRGLVWDETPRLLRACAELLGPTDALSGVMIARTILASVARALGVEFAPVKVDTVLVVLGRQGAKKSTFCSRMGGKWFGDSKVDLSDRKGVMTMLSHWWYEWPEVDKIAERHSDSESKAFISQSTDSFVPMYGRANITVSRTWIAVGTTNKPKFLTDATGDRRWWVVDIRKHPDIDLRKVDAWRDQLFAEAVVWFDRFRAEQASGVPDDDNAYRWWLNGAEEEARDARTIEFRTADMWAETVERFLSGHPIQCHACRGRKSTPGGNECAGCGGSGTIKRGPLDVAPNGRQFVTPVRILSEALGIATAQHQQNGTRISETLSRLGWASGARIQHNGAKVTPYYKPDAPVVPAEIDPDDCHGNMAEAAE